MSVTYRTELRLTCDNASCGEKTGDNVSEASFDNRDISPKIPTVARLKAVARKYGWLFWQDGTVLCPRCVRSL